MTEKLMVDSYTMPLDAELAKVYLESYQIDVSMTGEVIGGAAFALGPMLGGIRLFVDPADAPRATALLASYHEAQRTAGVQTYESADELAARALRTTLLGFLLFPVILHIYAMTMLIQVPRLALSKKGQKKYYAAWGLSSAVVAAVVIYGSYWVR